MTFFPFMFVNNKIDFLCLLMGYLEIIQYFSIGSEGLSGKEKVPDII